MNKRCHEQRDSLNQGLAQKNFNALILDKHMVLRLKGPADRRQGWNDGAQRVNINSEGEQEGKGVADTRAEFYI